MLQPAPAHAALTDNLVDYWSFDSTDISGTAVYDLSPGIHNTGTLAGSPASITGHIGQALHFDGSSTYARVPTFVGMPSSAMTLCTWLRTSYTAGEQEIFSINRNPSNYSNEGIFKIAPTTGKVTFWDFNGSVYGFPTTGSSNSSVTDGAWHQVCFTKNGTAGTYYIDGAANGTVTAAANVTYGNADIVVGKDYRDSVSYFNGDIDEVMVYSRALSAGEISQLYALTPSGAAALQTGPISVSALATNLTGFWSLDSADISGTTAYDRSAASCANNGTLVSAPTATAGHYGDANNARLFNGTSQYISVPYTTNAYNPSGDYSISVWVNPSNVSGAKGIISRDSPNGITPYLIYQNGATYLFYSSSNGSSWDISSGQSLGVATANTWSHLVIVRSGNTYYAYQNGVQTATWTSAALPWVNTYPFNIGRYYPGGSYFAGSIDEVMYYNRALSANEVAGLYNQLSSIGALSLHVAPVSPTVSITASTPDAGMPSTNGVFNISRGSSASCALPVGFSVSGTAVSGTNYTPIGTSATIAAGQSSTTVAVVPLIDVASLKTVIATLSASSTYTIGSPSSATVNLDPMPVLNISASIDNNGLATVQWSATGATSCTATGPNSFSFTALSSTQTTTPGVSPATYTLSCSTPLGAKQATATALSTTSIAALKSGLIDYWSFDSGDTTSTTAQDVSPNACSLGTLNGTPTPTTGHYGTANSALAFNGGNYVEGSTVGIANTISVSAWVYSTNFNQNAVIIEKEQMNTQWALLLESGLLKWRGGSATEITTALPSNNAWHHIVATQTGTTAKLYVDGVLVKTGAVTAIGNSTYSYNTIEIGRYNNAYYFTGSLDEVMVYNRVLSASEINQLYVLSSGSASALHSTPPSASGAGPVLEVHPGYAPAPFSTYGLPIYSDYLSGFSGNSDGGIASKAQPLLAAGTPADVSANWYAGTPSPLTCFSTAQSLQSLGSCLYFGDNKGTRTEAITATTTSGAPGLFSAAGIDLVSTNPAGACGVPVTHWSYVATGNSSLLVPKYSQVQVSYLCQPSQEYLWSQNRDYSCWPVSCNASTMSQRIFRFASNSKINGVATSTLYGTTTQTMATTANFSLQCGGYVPEEGTQIGVRPSWPAGTDGFGAGSIDDFNSDFQQAYDLIPQNVGLPPFYNMGRVSACWNFCYWPWTWAYYNVASSTFYQPPATMNVQVCSDPNQIVQNVNGTPTCTLCPAGKYRSGNSCIGNPPPTATIDAGAGVNGSGNGLPVSVVVGTPITIRATYATGAPVTTKKIYLTSGTTWTVPSDWNSSNNTIEVIGSGGGGAGGQNVGNGGAGGGGGAYSAITNLPLVAAATVNIHLGSGGAAGTGSGAGSAGGDTWFNGTTLANSSVGAKGGSGGTNASGAPAAAGGAAASGVGTTKFSGGSSGALGGNNAGSGGGGAAGPSGAGHQGGGSPTSSGSNRGGGGGGGAGGGSDSATASTNNGTAGGNGKNSSAGGAGGTSSVPAGGAGSGGSGGGGSYGNPSGVSGRGGDGGAGTDWDATHGAGGGGGGIGNGSSGTGGPGGAGGLYGGGGGGGANDVGEVGGAGAQGIIVITYTLAGGDPLVATAINNDSDNISVDCGYVSTFNGVSTSTYTTGSGCETRPDTNKTYSITTTLNDLGLNTYSAQIKTSNYSSYNGYASVNVTVTCWDHSHQVSNSCVCDPHYSQQGNSCVLDECTNNALFPGIQATVPPGCVQSTDGAYTCSAIPGSGYVAGGGECAPPGPPSNIVLSFTPSRVRSGESTTVTWSGTNVPAQCTISSNPPIAGLPLDVPSTITGNATGVSIGPVTQNTNIMLTCPSVVSGNGTATKAVGLIPVYQEI